MWSLCIQNHPTFDATRLLINNLFAVFGGTNENKSCALFKSLIEKHQRRLLKIEDGIAEVWLSLLFRHSIREWYSRKG
jgi:hypothetical protein